MLVFFDDLLIYRKSWKDHVQHVDKVLQLLKEQQLYAKPYKCFFGVNEVKYLGHIVSHEGVKVYPIEIQQEDPSENYAPTLGWSLGLFSSGSLFFDDEQILFIDDVYL